MIMMALLHMAGLENSEWIWKNPAQTGSGCIRFSDWKIENATFVEYSVQFVWGGPSIYI